MVCELISSSPFFPPQADFSSLSSTILLSSALFPQRHNVQTIYVMITTVSGIFTKTYGQSVGVASLHFIAFVSRLSSSDNPADLLPQSPPRFRHCLSSWCSRTRRNLPPPEGKRRRCWTTRIPPALDGTCVDPPSLGPSSLRMVRGEALALDRSRCVLLFYRRFLVVFLLKLTIPSPKTSVSSSSVSA
jgi:hypothetical protein